MLIKANWDNFKAKFSDNPQDNFEWFCYLLFSKEYNQPYGTHRYKNQSGIETDPIEIGDEVIGWQSKFYEDTLSNHKEDLLATLRKTKRDNPDITKIILYTNSEWGQGQGTKEPKAKTETEEKAKELNIELVWRVRSYFESPFVCQEQKDISSYFFELDVKWELSNYGLMDTLKEKYLNNFSTISLLTNNTSKPIDELFINLAIIKEQKEEKNKGNIINREALLNSYEEIHKPKEPIEIKELINTANKSLIYGKAGIGKTTICKYIAYKWANKELYQEFDYVVYISLREWKTKGLKGAIKDNYYSQDEDNITLDIKENTQKIIFLFDGYDELVADKKKDLTNEINYYALSHYIITSRPYGYQRNDFSVDEQFETIGFTDENVEEYIWNFFEDNWEKERSLEDYLKSNISIKHIAYIPLMLEMICSLWEEGEFSASLTMTELYSHVVENFLEKHSKNRDDETVYEWENREEIKKLLGKIAYYGLTKQTILFDGKFIQNTIGKDNLDFFKTSIVNSGFLKSDVKDKSLLGNNFEFPHLTFQEYFSALYVASLSKDEQSEIIRDWKFYPHMQIFFTFLGGLIEDKEFLFGEIESKPRDIIGYHELLLLSDCLNEMKGYSNQNFLDKINNKIIKYLNISIVYSSISSDDAAIHDSTRDIHTKIFNRIETNHHFHNKKMLKKLIEIINSSWGMDIDANVASSLHGITQNNFSFDEDVKPFLDENMFSDWEERLINGRSYDTFHDEKYNEKQRKSEYEKRRKSQILLTTNQIEEETGIKVKITNNQEFRKALLDILNFPFSSESNYVKKNAMDSLHKYFNISDNKTVNLALKFLKIQNDYIHVNEGSNLAHHSAKLLMSLKRSDDEFINMLLSVINDKSLNDKNIEIRHKISTKLFTLNNDTSFFVEELVSIIENEYIRFSNNIIMESVLKDSMTIAIFERLFNCNFKVYRPSDFGWNVSNTTVNSIRDITLREGIKVSVLFEAYDKKYDINTILLFNLLFDNKPLYLKNNKLHTIENGKEISTQREVDEETLNSIKMLLKVDDLNG